MIIKTYTEPTDVFICGIDFVEKEETFGITDDYCILVVKGTDKKKLIDTCGFVFINTKEEMIAMQGALEEDENQEWFFLKDYVGDISIHFEDDEENEYPIDEVDLDEYLSDSFPGEGWYDTVIDINCPLPNSYRGFESLLAVLAMMEQNQ